MRTEPFHRLGRLGAAIALLAICGKNVPAQTPPAPQPSSKPASKPSTPAGDLTDLSLEDLMNVEVTSVTKTRQKVADAPAAITVITQDDIRRSGMTSVPELLRMVPGLNVAQVTAGRWAISARGFPDVFSNKLLVLVDGRTVYQPLFSGVYWNAQNMVLQDIDRIEVVRGPGATLWGANAVNGVINITTRSARETQGGLMTANVGTDQSLATARYGGKLDELTYYRGYVLGRSVDDSVREDEGSSHDGWDLAQGGFRIDRYASAQDTLTLQGDLFTSRNGEDAKVPSFDAPEYRRRVETTYPEAGGNILGRWTRTLSEHSDFTLQAYYDRFYLQDLHLGYTQNTADIDFQHRLEAGSRQELIWGAGYRFQWDSVEDGEYIQFDPSHRSASLASAFIQDRVTLAPDRLQLFLGSKFELNSYSGFEVQPGARLLWTPNERNSIWAAVSRAVRTPSRFEEDASVELWRTSEPGVPVPISVQTRGNAGLRSEELLALETGYRLQATAELSLDVTGFYNDYEHLRSIEPAAPQFVAGPPPHAVLPVVVGNDMAAESWGVEASATYNLSKSWHVTASYTWLQLQAHRAPGSRDPNDEQFYEDNYPHNQASIRSYLNITRDLELNTMAYYVDNNREYRVPGYLRLDANVVWRPTKGLELSAGIRNALDGRHREHGQLLLDPATEVERSAFVQAVWSF